MTVTHSPTQLLPETTSILLSRQAQRPLQEPSLATEPVKEVQALSSTSSTQQSPPQASAQVWPPPEMFPSMQTTTSVNERPMSPSSMATSFFVKPRCSARRSPRASPPSSPLGPSRPPSSTAAMPNVLPFSSGGGAPSWTSFPYSSPPISSGCGESCRSRPTRSTPLVSTAYC